VAGALSGANLAARPHARRDSDELGRYRRKGPLARRVQKGNAAAYSLREIRARERRMAEQAERAYAQMVADWQAKMPKKGVAAASGARLPRPSAGQAARQDKAPDPALRSGVDHAHPAG
jgi:hypothetical protein